jgi:low affinity Fe/Cu permease
MKNCGTHGEFNPGSYTQLIFAANNARNELIHIEHLTEDQLDQLGQRYSKLAAMHQNSLNRCVGDAMPEAGEAKQ